MRLRRYEVVVQESGRRGSYVSGESSVSAALVHHNQYSFRAASNNHESGRRTEATRTIHGCQWECERAQSPPEGSWSRSASRSVSKSASGECARGAGAGAHHTSASALRPRSNPTHSALADTAPTCCEARHLASPPRARRPSPAAHPSTTEKIRSQVNQHFFHAS